MGPSCPWIRGGLVSPGPTWVKVDAYLDENARIEEAGFDGAAVYQFLLRLNRRHGFNGLVPPRYADPKYIGRKIHGGLRPARVRAALARCEAAGLVTFSEGNVEILGFDEVWRTSLDSTERSRKRRSEKKAKSQAISGPPATEGNAEQLSETECTPTRGEEIGEEPPPTPPAGGTAAWMDENPCPEVRELAARWQKCIRKRKPDHRFANGKLAAPKVRTWSRHLRLLLADVDGDSARLTTAMDWLASDDCRRFWSWGYTNVWEPKGFRDRFDSIESKISTGQMNARDREQRDLERGGRRGGSTPEDRAALDQIEARRVADEQRKQYEAQLASQRPMTPEEKREMREALADFKSRGKQGGPDGPDQPVA